MAHFGVEFRSAWSALCRCVGTAVRVATHHIRDKPTVLRASIPPHSRLVTTEGNLVPSRCVLGAVFWRVETAARACSCAPAPYHVDTTLQAVRYNRHTRILTLFHYRLLHLYLLPLVFSFSFFILIHFYSLPIPTSYTPFLIFFPVLSPSSSLKLSRLSRMSICILFFSPSKQTQRYRLGQVTTAPFQFTIQLSLDDTGLRYQQKKVKLSL